MSPLCLKGILLGVLITHTAPILGNSYSLNIPHGRREARGVFEWLFGPAVKADKENNVPIIHHQHTRLPNNSYGVVHPTSTNSKSQVDTTAYANRRAEVNSFNIAFSNASTSFLNESSSATPTGNSTNDQHKKRELLIPKPRGKRDKNFPSFIQIDRQRGKRSIDHLGKNTSEGVVEESIRVKKEVSNKFRQLNVPYGHGHSSNNRIDTLSKRQLLLSPAEQMLAVRQQQEFAAASMLQQQLLYDRYNRYIDDYYDDDSSYEDSYEYYDRFNRRGLRPIFEAMRHGVALGPPHHPYPIRRRSLLTDENEMGGKGASTTTEDKTFSFLRKQGRNQRPVRGQMGKKESPLVGPISKGREDAIEDYDLSSDFNKLYGMVSAPNSRMHETETRTEKGESRGRSNLGMKKKERNEDVNTSISTSDPNETDMGEPTTIQTSTLASEEEQTEEGSEENNNNTSAPTNPTEPPGTSEEESETRPTIQSSAVTELPGEAINTSKKPKPSRPKPTRTTTQIPQTSTVSPFQQTLNCRCGVQSVRGHEIGEGTVLRTMINPWLVAVRTKQNKHLCSGSIINNKYILTSKNCVQGAKGLIVIAGISTGIPKNFSVIRVNGHKTRNLALLKVKQTIAPNFAMRPICLPIGSISSQKTVTEGTGTLVTFKRNSPKDSSRVQLVQTEIPLSSKCPSSAGGPNSGNICPGPPGTMKCGGDVGGILQVYQRGYSYEQIGIVSNTVGCRTNKTPGIYADVRKSVKWILQNTKDAKYCRKPKVTPQDFTSQKYVGEGEVAEDVSYEQEDEEEVEDNEWQEGFREVFF